MCGIFGVFEKDICQNSKSLKKTGDLLAHRGPDDFGFKLYTEGIGLFHRRLSINDLSPKGRQPFVNPELGLSLVCNGEIYNYSSLKATLEESGYSFYSRSDSEVVMFAYHKWGKSFVNRLEGMFSFAIYDENARDLIIARDRVGVKPLYYLFDEVNKVFSFSSEATPIAKRYALDIDYNNLSYVLTLGYIPAPHSAWKNLNKLPPGHLLTFSTDTLSLSVEKYWSPPDRLDNEFNQSYFEDLFQETVSNHMMSDVPVGLFLSGGLDSTAIGCVMSEARGTTKALTLAFPQSPNDESQVAASTTNELGLSHQVIISTEQSPDELIQKTVPIFDEPQGYSALMTMNQLSLEASRHGKVFMSGDGGDEVFGGYNWYKDLGFRGAISSVFPRRKVKFSSGVNEVQAALNSFSSRSILHRHAMRLFPRFLPEEANLLFNPIDVRFSEEQMLSGMASHFKRSLPTKKALQIVDLMNFCSDSILPKVDRASMAHSIEVRVPLLDRRIIEYGLSTKSAPDQVGNPKQPLRSFITKFKTSMTALNFPKQGFSYRGFDNYNWKNAIASVDNSFLAKEGILDKRWESLLNLELPYAHGRIWTLLFLAKWVDYQMEGR